MRRRLTRASAALVPATLALALAACVAEPDFRPCPPIGSPAGLERMTVFVAGGGEDLTEVVYEARVDGVDSVCEYDESGLKLALNIRLIAERGPADAERLAAFKYFVAVEDGVGAITAKEIYDIAMPFEGNRRRVGVLEEIDVVVPTPADKSFADIRILVGLQITPEQVDYNQRRRAR